MGKCNVHLDTCKRLARWVCMRILAHCSPWCNIMVVFWRRRRHTHLLLGGLCDARQQNSCFSTAGLQNYVHAIAKKNNMMFRMAALDWIVHARLNTRMRVDELLPITEHTTQAPSRGSPEGQVRFLSSSFCSDLVLSILCAWTCKSCAPASHLPSKACRLVITLAMIWWHQELHKHAHARCAPTLLPSIKPHSYLLLI